MKKICFVSIMLLLVTTTLHAKPYKVAMFYPREAPFWTIFTDFMHEAANDLEIEFQMHVAEDNQYLMQRQLTRVVVGPNKVDAVVFNNFRQMAPNLIKIAEDAKVISFLVNSALSEDDAIVMGVPREKYKYWIGEMLPDEEGAGIAITNHLIDAAISKKQIHKDGKVHVVGINGPVAAGSAVMRRNTLNKTVANRSDAKLIQVVHSEQWSKLDAKMKFINLKSRYPDVFVFWAGSARLADGIIEGAHQLNLTPGKDFVTGGVGIKETMLKRVQSGEVLVASGGHFIEGAWVMVILYDYFHGIDFAQSGGSQLRSPMVIVTKDNVDYYLNNLSKEKLSKESIKKVDFTQYSMKLNPKLKGYRFDLNSVLSQL